MVRTVLGMVPTATENATDQRSPLEYSPTLKIGSAHLSNMFQKVGPEPFGASANL